MLLIKTVLLNKRANVAGAMRRDVVVSEEQVRDRISFDARFRR